MKWMMMLASVVVAGLLGGCTTPPVQEEVPMYSVVIGEKNDLFEVTSPTSLRLAPGIRSEIVDGPGGNKCGILLLRQNGSVGGYMSCGCIGATTSSCVTTNDNPEHPSCSGSCTDSEGNAHACSLFGPLIGPPKDPAMIRFRGRSKG